ncbi:acid-sensing ion channel 3-like [Mantella aurantiaca]
MDILKPPQGAEEEEDHSKASDLATFVSNSTLHGISHVFLPGGVTPRRVFWACAFLASLSCFLFQVADRIMYYSEFHHVTTLDEEESQLMTFPAITICNYNSFRKSKLTRNDLDGLDSFLGWENSKEEAIRTLNLQDDPFNRTKINMQEFYNRTGHSLDEMILECRYRNEACGPRNFSVVSTRSAWGI